MSFTEADELHTTFAAAGDIALTSTHYEHSTDAPDGSRTVTHVATADVSRQQADGSWRLVIDSPAFA